MKTLLGQIQIDSSKICEYLILIQTVKPQTENLNGTAVMQGLPLKNFFASQNPDSSMLHI
jgi:hypothetical protein